MFGKYFDQRVHRHFVHTYSRVPYLDSEIYNIETNSLRESRKAQNRVSLATQGIERAKEKSEKLTVSLRDSRIRRQKQTQDFMCTLQESQKNCLQKEKQSWINYEDERTTSRYSYLQDQKYLDGLLKSNSTKAESRLASVRRWH